MMTFDAPHKKSFENIVGKRENVGDNFVTYTVFMLYQ